MFRLIQFSFDVVFFYMCVCSVRIIGVIQYVISDVKVHTKILTETMPGF